MRNVILLCVLHACFIYRLDLQWGSPYMLFDFLPCSDAQMLSHLLISIIRWYNPIRSDISCIASQYQRGAGLVFIMNNS